jgi:hypothetical protein
VVRVGLLKFGFVWVLVCCVVGVGWCEGTQDCLVVVVGFVVCVVWLGREMCGLCVSVDELCVVWLVGGFLGVVWECVGFGG